MTRPRDYAFEALAEVTGSDWTAARGELNSALASISLQEPQMEPASMTLADEIHRRAKLYREVMDGAILTPNALSKHWRRVLEESEKKKPSERPTNQSVDVDCSTCGGNRFVVVVTRPPVASNWMRERGIEPHVDRSIDETAPCPDCNAGCQAFHRRPDGSRAVPPDPARVREMLSR